MILYCGCCCLFIYLLKNTYIVLTRARNVWHWRYRAVLSLSISIYSSVCACACESECRCCHGVELLLGSDFTGPIFLKCILKVRTGYAPQDRLYSRNILTHTNTNTHARTQGKRNRCAAGGCSTKVGFTACGTGGASLRSAFGRRAHTCTHCDAERRKKEETGRKERKRRIERRKKKKTVSACSSAPGAPSVA